MGNIFKIPWPWPIVIRPDDPLVNATTTECGGLFDAKYYADVSILSTAAFLFLVLNLLKYVLTRKSPLDVVVPVDLLNSSPFRIIYCVIMTLWAADTFQDLVSHDLHYHSPDNGVLDAAKFFGLSPTVIFLREALIYFPVLACVDFTLPCLGHYIGFFYTILVGCYNAFWEYMVLNGCSHKGTLDTADTVISVLTKTPILVGYVGVASWYFCHGTMETVLVISTRHKIKNQMKEYDEDHCYEHVRSLFRRPLMQGPIFHLKKNICSYAYLGFNYVLPYRSGSECLEYPLSFLAAISMAWMVLYQLILQLMKREVQFAHHFIDFVNSFNITVAALSEVLPSRKETIESIFYDFQSLGEAMLIILPFGTAIGVGLCGFFTMYLVQNFRKRLKRAAKGDIAFLVASEPLPSKTYILAAYMKYCAFQVGYLVFCAFLYSFMEISLLSFGMGFYYLFKNFTFMAIRIWSWVMVPMMWAAVLHHLQLVLCRYIFLKKEEEEEEEGGDMVHIRFKSLYQLCTYLFFYFNVIFAMVMSFLRVFASFMFTVVMYMRIDWDVYMRGLEGWDFGHRTYVGYMYLEYTRNNAILRTFVQLLTQKIRQRINLRESSRETTPKRTIQRSLNRDKSPSSEPELEKVQLLTSGKPTLLRARKQGYDGTVRSRRVRNLWQVAYTLIHNPQLIELTGSSLKASFSEPLLRDIEKSIL